MTNLPSPCYVLDENKLESNLKLIRQIGEAAEVEIILAFKGFAMWRAFPLVRKYFSGATASSLHEALLCDEHMESKAHSYCVAYRPDEFEQLLKLSSHITFNSLSQYAQYQEDIVNRNISVGLRVNPQWSDVSTELYNPASKNSRLGVSPDELTGGLPEGIEGLHLHVLCESDSFALEKVLVALEEKFGHLLSSCKWVNLGGGHLMTRDGYDLEHLISILKAFKQKYNVHLILEPGSAFAWQAGDLHTRVLDIVDREGVQTAVIDASFTCHMPDCLEMPYRPEIIEGSSDANELEYKFRLGGVSCLAGDYLEAYSFDDQLRIGDPITFKDMIHYTMVKTTTFNGVQHPAIAIRRKNGEVEVVRQFDYHDYKSRLS